jgi:uncharacterized iron-regulated membrane protein
MHMHDRYNEGASRQPTLLARRRSLFWRIHFWAALVASPFALIATLTGILYIFTPQIEDALYGHLERVAPAGNMLPLDRAVAGAQAAAAPGLAVHSVVPPYAADDAVKVNLAPAGARTTGHEGHQHGAKPGVAEKPTFGLPAGSVAVYVNPYSGAVLGTLGAQERFGNWSKQLHSRLLQGDNWRWMIELAASWLMVMLVTGVWLCLPGNGAVLLPKPGAKGRAAWRQWHAFLGVALGIMSLLILTTGLTWSRYAGAQVRAARDAIGQTPPAVPRDVQSHPLGGAGMLQWQGAWDASRLLAPDVALQLVAPRGEHGVWKASAAERGQPTKRFDLLLDAYTGKQLYLAGWERQPAFGKATAIGIPFHRGEFGWWNQLLLLIFGLGMLFSLVSGWVMYFKRRRSRWLDLPRMLPGAWRSPSPLCWLTAVAMFAMMPLLALSAALLIAIEVAIGWRHVRHPFSART